MYEDEVVLCAANAYEKNFYLNPDFDALPQSVKDELKIMCVLYTEEISGILTLLYDKEGNLLFKVTAKEDDFAFDDIGSALKIKDLREKKKDLLTALELYYRVFFLGEEV